ncbi:MAG: DNA methyltransferase [Methylovulum sp.]|nr:DNA methyltransferase [Methylovulum sp.]
MNNTNVILQGDCLEAMRSITPNSIDLIYLDPPFFTEKTHKLKNKARTVEFSFDDVWGSNKAYADFLFQRIAAMAALLKETGSIFVHCDKNGEHIVRAILDNVFGTDNFQSEIIWTYKRWSNAKKGLLPSHQNIYFYSKSPSFTFNPEYTDYSESTNVDQILQKRTRDNHNKVVYKREEDGSIQHADEKRGVPLGDVWDIPYLNPKAKERVGYPTQKPLLLLERIISIASNEGDTVLDPFCGSGTTCVAAQLLHRKFIGIDYSEAAVQLAKSRLKAPVKTESNLLKKGRAAYLNADQKALSLLVGLEFNPIHRNKGIDAILTELYQGAPVLIRVQREHESLATAAQLLIAAKKTKKAKKAILIRHHRDNLLEDDIAFEGLDIIDSPALSIAKYCG